MKQEIEYTIWSLVFLLLMLAGLGVFFGLTSLFVHWLMEG